MGIEYEYCIGHVNRVSEREVVVKKGREVEAERGSRRERRWKVFTSWITSNQDGMNSYLFFILDFVTLRNQ